MLFLSHDWTLARALDGIPAVLRSGIWPLAVWSNQEIFTTLQGSNLESPGGILQVLLRHQAQGAVLDGAPYDVLLMADLLYDGTLQVFTALFFLDIWASGCGCWARRIFVEVGILAGMEELHDRSWLLFGECQVVVGRQSPGSSDHFGMQFLFFSTCCLRKANSARHARSPSLRA